MEGRQANWLGRMGGGLQKSRILGVCKGSRPVCTDWALRIIYCAYYYLAPVKAGPLLSQGGGWPVVWRRSAGPDEAPMAERRKEEKWPHRHMSLGPHWGLVAPWRLQAGGWMCVLFIHRGRCSSWISTTSRCTTAHHVWGLTTRASRTRQTGCAARWASPWLCSLAVLC